RRRFRDADAGAGQAPAGLHVAAFRALCLPDGGGESPLLRRPLPGAQVRAAVAPRPALSVLEPGTLPRPVGGEALGRHEAEAGALLRPGPPAGAPAPRRAHL